MNGHQNQQGGRRGGRGGRGPNLTFELFVEGARHALTVFIRLFEGQFPKTGSIVTFFLGSEAVPTKIALQDATNQPLRAQINNLGFATQTMNLTNFPADAYTHITAMTGNRMVTKPIPVEVGVQGKVVGGKFLKVMPTEEELKSATNTFCLNIQSFAKDGKPSKAKLRITASTLIDVCNVITGRQPGNNVRSLVLNTDNNGLLSIEVAASGFECALTIVHLESGESVAKKLRFK